MPQNCVGVCSECEHGILVLEPHFHTGGPAPKWRIACNNMKCKEMVDCFEGSTDVQSCKEICDCGSYLLTVDLSKVAHLPENVERCVHKGCWRYKPVPTMASARIQRWAQTLSAYDYRIVFRAGKENSNADGLSRLPLRESPSSVPVPGDTVLMMEALSDMAQQYQPLP
ncbi:hypothetical protein EMCRGX_G030814 [Ephydatia muelleri]